MRELLKRIYKKSPLLVKRSLLGAREYFSCLLSYHKEKKEYSYISKNTKKNNVIKNILIYHISGMYYAGTEKTLQTIAGELAREYNVFFMYSKDNFSQNQKDLLDPRVTCIEFSYTDVDKKFPYFIYGMQSHIKEVLAREDIDLLITSSSGHSQYPFNTIKNIPIILINIFGSPSLQKNIISTVFISKTTQDYSEQYTGKKKSNIWAYPTVTPSKKDITLIKHEVRNRMKIPEDAFVFGRIGRPSDDIYDPIGIEAFKRIVAKNPSVYYLIMSPPPILIKKVEEESIPNILYMPNKEDIWNFYYTIDALAHFRLDGETFGLNIAEAMYAGNPIITHKSHIWNAHLEYLDTTFSRVTEKDDVDTYESYMEEFINLHTNDLAAWKEMRARSQKVAEKSFNRERYGSTIKNIITSLS